jgi:hypothetical protein
VSIPHRLFSTFTLSLNENNIKRAALQQRVTRITQTRNASVLFTCTKHATLQSVLLASLFLSLLLSRLP